MQPRPFLNSLPGSPPLSPLQLSAQRGSAAGGVRCSATRDPERAEGIFHPQLYGGLTSGEPTTCCARAAGGSRVQLQQRLGRSRNAEDPKVLQRLGVRARVFRVSAPQSILSALTVAAQIHAKLVQSVSGSRALQQLPNFGVLFPSFQGRVSCVMRSVRRLCSFGDKAGFPPLTFPHSKDGDEPPSRSPSAGLSSDLRPFPASGEFLLACGSHSSGTSRAELRSLPSGAGCHPFPPEGAVSVTKQGRR